MSDPYEAEAIKLLKQLQVERGTGILGVAVKDRPTTKTILAAKPEVQVAYVRHIVRLFGKLGARKGKKIPAGTAWFHNSNVPTSGEQIAKQLLRRRLPFTEEMFGEMFEQIAGMIFICFAPALEQLVGQLEKHSAGAPLPPRIRQAAARVADGLLIKDWPKADAENWGMPHAADRKLAARIEKLLAR